MNKAPTYSTSDSLVSTDYPKLAGGDNDHIFFTSPGETNSHLAHLMEWTRTTAQTADLGLVNEYGNCHFVNATRGGVIAPDLSIVERSPDVLITSDEGKTWISNKDVLGPEIEVGQLLWISPDQLLVGGRGATALCQVDDKGNLSKQWNIKLQGSMFPGPGNTAWLNIDNHAMKIDLATGKTLASVAHHLRINAIAEIGPDLWVAGDEDAAIFHAGADGQWSLAKQFGYHWPPSAFSNNNGKVTPEPPGGWVQWIVTGIDGRALLIGTDGQTYTWDGKSDALATSPLIIDNTAVVAAAQAAADAVASPEQIREMTQLAGKIGYDRIGDLLAAQKEKEKAEHWTKRQSMAWLIAEMKKIVDAEAKNGRPPAPTATGKFDSSISFLQIFSPTSGLAITGQGIAVTNGDLDHWKGQMGWPKPQGIGPLVGATENQFYFISSDLQDITDPANPAPPGSFDTSVYRGTKEVHVRCQYTLMHWTKQPDGGKLTEIRKLPLGVPTERHPPAACNFFDQQTGAFVDAQTFLVTRDAGVTWVQTPLSLRMPGFNTPSGVQQLLFCNENQPVITAGYEALALLSLDKVGHPTPATLHGGRAEIQGLRE